MKSDDVVERLERWLATEPRYRVSDDYIINIAVCEIRRLQGLVGSFMCSKSSLGINGKAIKDVEEIELAIHGLFVAIGMAKRYEPSFVGRLTDICVTVMANCQRRKNEAA